MRRNFSGYLLQSNDVYSENDGVFTIGSFGKRSYQWSTVQQHKPAQIHLQKAVFLHCSHLMMRIIFALFNGRRETYLSDRTTLQHTPNLIY